MLRHANSITVLRCTSSSNITIIITTATIIISADRIQENVFVHMRRHASGARGDDEEKELIFRVYCICIHIYAHKTDSSCNDQSIAEVKKKRAIILQNFKVSFTFSI
jgi:hypothetical protein